MKDISESLTLRYFDIAWLSHYDGPGYRVVLFLQGCHLRCPWCHSPHSQEGESSLLYFPSRCTYCGYCEKVCNYEVHHVSLNKHLLSRKNCVKCGRCIEVCPVSNQNRQDGALVLPTKEITVLELWHLLYPQLDLLSNIGGLTVSGGEALLQSQMLRELFLLCKKEGFHITVETSGAIARKHILDVVDYVDCWLYGLRPSPIYTPTNANYITDNLSYLSSNGHSVIIRMPVISGITDLPESLDRISEIMKANSLREIQLLPFNLETSHYYNAMGKECFIGDEAIVSSQKLDRIRNYFKRKKISVSII